MDGDEYHADMSTLASPASQGSPDVYILPLTEVSLPVAKQPARSGESLRLAQSGQTPLLHRLYLFIKIWRAVPLHQDLHPL